MFLYFKHPLPYFISILDAIAEQALIPPAPPGGCPDGTFTYNDTCCCQSTCCWDNCHITPPPKTCLMDCAVNVKCNWFWDDVKSRWVAQLKLGGKIKYNNQNVISSIFYTNMSFIFVIMLRLIDNTYFSKL